MSGKRGVSSLACTKLCILCGSESFSLTRYVFVGKREREFILKHFGEAPPDDSFLCKKHVIEARRHHKNSDFVPKWKPQWGRDVQKCMNPTCSHSEYKKVIKSAFRPVRDICEALGLDVSTNELVLCALCYQEVYSQFHYCRSCGAFPKTGKFKHHSPDAERIAKYFKESSGDDINIKKDDCLCLTCYKIYTSDNTEKT